jgi:hypothetical protein
MKHLLEPFTIVSAYRKELAPNVNMTRHIEALEFLQNASIPHKEVYGYYEGEGERSILIVGGGCNSVADTLRARYDQDCYLYVNQDREAQLRGRESSQDVGTWNEVGKEDAMLADGFTVDPDTGKYYVCK